MNPKLHKALFLDRDGVINKEVEYLHKIEHCQFMDGIFELSRAAVEAGYKMIIVTNQSGIGRGYFTEADFDKLMEHMSHEFSEAGAPLTATYFCPYHPTHGKGKYLKDSELRKPKPGMILRAQIEHNIDLKKSILLGDSESDIIAAKNGGIGTSILLVDSHKKNNIEADYIVDNLLSAMQFLK